ncbi:MAG: hypothetical protein HUU10_15495 [Bacteroidetes bacterium]|nr:hypothetical protein [Bacteroidota bacterium]
MQFRLILIFISCSSVVYSQSEMTLFEAKINQKIEIGMSIDEVKKKMGKPDEIRPGFPDTDSRVIDSYPDHAGQLVYSSWVYIQEPIKVKLLNESETKHLLNNVEVSEMMYKDYESLDSVYYAKGEIIFPTTISAYKLQKIKVNVIEKDKRTTKILPKDITTRKVSITPLVYVVFDRGTQSVARVIVLFLE